MKVVTTKPSKAESIVITANADMAPRKTWTFANKEQIIDWIFLLPSACCCSWPESQRWKRFCLQSQKQGSPTEIQQSRVRNLRKIINCCPKFKIQINHSIGVQIAPLCSVTLKAGSSVMLMFVTPVASGIHVGSIFSGLGSMSETYGEGFEIKLYFERRKK